MLVAFGTQGRRSVLADFRPVARPASRQIGPPRKAICELLRHPRKFIFAPCCAPQTAADGVSTPGAPDVARLLDSPWVGPLGSLGHLAAALLDRAGDIRAVDDPGDLE